MNKFINCKICGKQLRRIGNWHLRAHEMTIKDYKEKFGKDSMISEQTKFNLGNGLRGKKRPLHSLRMKGKNNPAFGGRSEKTCALISKNRKGKGIGIAGKYKRTIAIREKISGGVQRAIIEGRDHQHGSYHTGYYFSKKSNKKYFYRSSWEKIVMEYLDKHSQVTKWRYESFAIKYKDQEGILRNYIPDFYVEFLDGAIKEVWEVKPQFAIEKCKNKFEALDDFLKNNSDIIDNSLIITEDEIEMMKTYEPEEEYD